MKNTWIRWAGAVLLLPLAFVACDNAEDLVGVEDDARLSLYLTDAPGNVAAVWVEITGATLHGDGGDVVLMDESTGLIEITTLVNTAQELVDDAEIPAGTYGKLTLMLGDAVLETDDGDVYALGDAAHPDGLAVTGELKCPSCAQSGLKVMLHGMTVDEGDNALVLDFDVSQSFGHEAGKSGKWVMRPVIHTSFVRDGDDDLDDESVSIEGTVALATGVTIPECPAGSARSIRDFVPMATAANLLDDAGSPVVRTASVDADGEFEMDFVSADTYTLGFDDTVELTGSNLTFQATVSPTTVTVAGEDVDGVAYTITGATCSAVAGG